MSGDDRNRKIHYGTAGEFCTLGSNGISDIELHEEVFSSADKWRLKRLAEKNVKDAIDRGVPADVARSLYGWKEET